MRKHLDQDNEAVNETAPRTAPTSASGAEDIIPASASYIDSAGNRLSIFGDNVIDLAKAASDRGRLELGTGGKEVRRRGW